MSEERSWYVVFCGNSVYGDLIKCRDREDAYQRADQYRKAGYDCYPSLR